MATFREVIPLRRATPSTAADQSATTARSCTPGVHPGSGGAGSPLGPSLAARDSNPLLGGELVVIQVRCRTPINKMGALGALQLLPPPAARLKLPVCPASRPYYIPGDWALRCCSPNHHHARGPDRIYAVLTCGTSRIRRDLQAQVQISSTKRPFLASGPRQCDQVVILQLHRSRPTGRPPELSSLCHVPKSPASHHCLVKTRRDDMWAIVDVHRSQQTARETRQTKQTIAIGKNRP